MASTGFWLTNEQFARLAARLPTDTRGVARVDDRRVISGIIHVLQSGCRWRDCPPEYGPHTTVYNRWNRWSRRAVWLRLFEALREVSADAFHSIDSTTAKAHRSAGGGKGGRKRKLLAVPAVGARPKSTPSAMRSGVPSLSR